MIEQAEAAPQVACEACGRPLPELVEVETSEEALEDICEQVELHGRAHVRISGPDPVPWFFDGTVTSG